MADFLEIAERLHREGTVADDSAHFELVFRARNALQAVLMKSSIDLSNIESVLGAFEYALHCHNIAIDYSLSESQAESATPVLKLHGSLNWAGWQSCEAVTPLEVDKFFASQQWTPNPKNGEIQCGYSTAKMSGRRRLPRRLIRRRVSNERTLMASGLSMPSASVPSLPGGDGGGRGLPGRGPAPTPPGQPPPCPRSLPGSRSR